MISDGAAGSLTWNWLGGLALLDAAGNVAEEATVHVSAVPGAGTSPPPLVTVVEGWLAKTSAAVMRLPDSLA
jgi:hypothetical protein